MSAWPLLPAMPFFNSLATLDPFSTLNRLQVGYP
jgi:hypothetical protein